MCQTRADYDLFTRELVDKQKLRLNVIEQEGGKTLSQHNRPCSQDRVSGSQQPDNCLRADKRCGSSSKSWASRPSSST